MNNLQTFNEFVNESTVSEAINEGVLAKQGVAKLSDYSLEGAHDSDMEKKIIKRLYKSIQNMTEIIHSNLKFLITWKAILEDLEFLE